jgi:hypothetical protein
MGRIGKSIEKLVNFGKVAIVSLPLIAGVYGCEKNYAPEAYLEVSPKSGDAPLEVRMEVNGDDRNGVEDITEYRLGINSEVIKSKTPIDLTRIFENEGKMNIYGEVVDSEGEVNKTPVVGVEVYRGPFIEQSVSLNNDVNVKYSATLSKVDKAQLSVKKNNSQIFSQEITDVNESGTDYDKTFTYADNGFTKGDYEFVLTSGEKEKKNSVNIPNYKPTANFTNINIDMEEDGNVSTTLGNIYDKNPEDVASASYTNAKSLDGKTSASLAGNELEINALPNQTGDYRVEVEYGSTEGGLEKSVLTGNITPHTWLYLVNPFVQPNDTTKAIVWNNFSTPSQRNAHFDDRLYNYDKTDEIENPDWDCADYGRELAIHFNGYPMDGLEHNNEHNIPMYVVYISAPNSTTHTIDGIVMGDYVSDITSWRFVEPQSDSTYSAEGLKGLGTNRVRVNYTFVNKYDGLLDNVPMFEFVLNDNGEWVDSGYRNPDINLVEQRKK